MPQQSAPIRQLSRKNRCWRMSWCHSLVYLWREICPRGATMSRTALLLSSLLLSATAFATAQVDERALKSSTPAPPRSVLSPANAVNYIGTTVGGVSWDRPFANDGTWPDGAGADHHWCGGGAFASELADSRAAADSAATQAQNRRPFGLRFFFGSWIARPSDNDIASWAESPGRNASPKFFRLRDSPCFHPLILAEP